MKCKNCGNQFRKGNFCPSCGYNMKADTAQIDRKKKRNRHIVTAIAVIALLVIIGSMFYLSLGGGLSSFLEGYSVFQKTDLTGVVKGTALTDDEAAEILFSDVTDEDWAIFEESNDAISQIVSRYSNESGYVEKDDVKKVINAVAAKVDSLYEEGIINWYSCDESGVTFEYSCGLSAIYVPSLEGYLSGDGEINILTIDPSEDFDSIAYTTGKEICETLDKDSVFSLENEEVTLSALRSLPESSILLWNGHGCMSEDGSALLTGSSASEMSWSDPIDYLKAYIGKSGVYWAITPKFVQKYISMNQGLVYLSACKSGYDDRLVEAFMSSGAEVVFANVGNADANAYYSQMMMLLIMEYMGAIQDEGVFYTAREALELTTQRIKAEIQEKGGVTMEDGTHYASFEEWVNGVQGDTHVEIRGAEAYTLCSCIRGAVKSYTETDLSEISGTLTVTLEDENGNFVASSHLQNNMDFYFNNLEPGMYYVSLYQDEELISLRTEIHVQPHRYTPVTLPYRKPVSLEGDVYDMEGNLLSGVTITAVIKDDPSVFQVSASTDENGSYGFKVYGSTTYTATYSLEGYDTAEIEIDVTSEMYENAQKGISSELDDVILSKQKVPEELYASQVVKFMKGDPWTEKPDAQNSFDVLGKPDYNNDRNALTLGGSGMLIVSFEEVFTDLEGADITIYEVGPEREPVEVAVSSDSETWYIVGITTGGTSGIDINGSVPEGLEFQYIRVIDLETAADGDWPGADIDAIGINVLR